METVTAKEDIQNVKKEDATSPQHEGAQPSSTGTTTNNITKNNGDNGAATDGDGKEKPPATKVSRKRTKTGCLTCRKRRIKCGEERPTCNNCIKSKRVCEGYNQRVVFKDGMNAMRQCFPMGPGRFTPIYPLQPAPGPQPLQPIAPAPPGFPRPEESVIPLDQTIPPHLRHAYADRDQQQSPAYGGIDVSVPIGLPGVSPQARQGEFRPEYQGGYHMSPVTQGSPQEYHHSPASASGSSYTMSAHPGDSASVYGDAQATYGSSPQLLGSSRSPSSSFSPPSHQSSGSSCPFNPPIPEEYITSRRPSTQPLNESFKFEDGADPSTALPDDFFDNFEEFLEQTSNDIDYDRESDDDMEEDENEDAEYRYGSQEDGMIAMETSNHGQIQHQQISEILRPFSKHLDEHSRISFQSFLPEASALASYMPTLSSSPLMNPVTAKIFCHFVYVLGPRLHGPQNIWSYTIPMLSLSHPPLLHAILALSSLHISKLTKGGDKPSLLHYHIALRRLGKAIASDRHRGHVATLAATLMLAYYETMAAEHDKWSSHIHGAKQLLKEVDFDRVTKRVELADDEEALITEQRPANGASLLHQRRLRRQMIADDQVDDNFKSLLMGSKVKRQNKAKKAHSDRPFTKKELETLRLQSDLFWWYTKMDCFQSLLSGCPLVLDYIHWDQCPPRSRIGTLGTPYGSSDHYFLLLGRLCDFQVRDLARKKAVLAANNGQWIPPPEMNGPPRSQRPHFAPPNYIAPPVQYGMIPTPNGPPRMPSAFGAVPVPSNYPSPPSASEDLHTLTDAALQEWNEIKAAFEALQTSLGPDYDPLPLEYMPVQHTPFGDALYYKSYSIASLQMLYSMALIVLHRCHPDMPPQSMMAASIQSPRTTPHANTIARIVAGLVPTDVTTQINPALGASLIEASMPMFFSAVQFQLPEQRDWAVRKLREIHRLTGWATASRILLGCQRAWEMLAEKGKGPKYERPRMEEEAEMFYEYHNYYVALAKGARDEARVVEEVEGGQGEAMWRWKVSGRRTVDAAGILGERMDAGGVAGLGLEGA